MMEQDCNEPNRATPAARINPAKGNGFGRRKFLIRSFFALAGGAVFSRGWAEPVASATTYIVKSGDTLSEIALSHGLSVKQIKALNNLRSDTIFPRQELHLAPAKESFTLLKPALEKIDAPKISPGHWKHIILHHSATPYGNASSFDRYHRQERKMENGLAYHFVIGNGTNSRNGEVEVGVRWKGQIAGGHVATESYNQNSIGICLVGNFEVKKPSTLQVQAARQLITYLRDHLLQQEVKFLVHKEIEKTLCPGRYFPVREFHETFG